MTDDLYFCPASREVECATGGGFSACCDRPQEHLAMPDTPGTAAVSEALSEAARERFQLAELMKLRTGAGFTMEALARKILEKRQAMAARDSCLVETNRAREAEQAALRRVAELENVITWDTTCGNCAKLLDTGYAETARAEKAEALIRRVRDVTAPEPASGWQATYYDGWGDALAAVGDALDVRDWEVSS